MRMKFSLKQLSFALCILVLVSTAIVLFIVYKDLDNSFSHMFILAYLIFMMLCLVYFIILIFIFVRKLTWYEFKKKMFYFFIAFIGYSAVIILFNYFFVKKEIIYTEVAVYSASIALGMTFVTSIFSSKNKA